jgi:hypothetical protein
VDSTKLEFISHGAVNRAGDVALVSNLISFSQSSFLTNKVTKYNLGGIFIYPPLSVGKVLSDNTVLIVDSLNNVYNIIYTGTTTART